MIERRVGDTVVRLGNGDRVTNLFNERRNPGRRKSDKPRANGSGGTPISVTVNGGVCVIGDNGTVRVSSADDELQARLGRVEARLSGLEVSVAGRSAAMPSRSEIGRSSQSYARHRRRSFQRRFNKPAGLITKSQSKWRKRPGESYCRKPAHVEALEVAAARLGLRAASRRHFPFPVPRSRRKSRLFPSVSNQVAAHRRCAAKS